MSKHAPLKKVKSKNISTAVPVIDKSIAVIEIGCDQVSLDAGLTKPTRILFAHVGICPCVEGRFREFQTDASLRYEPFCDDFGPLKMICIFDFIDSFKEAIKRGHARDIDQLVYYVEEGRRSFTNAVFLLGAYMILCLHYTLDLVSSKFAHVDPGNFEGFRDATFSPPIFRLSLMDCWRGLHRGMSLGWVAEPSTTGSSYWGEIDKNEYQHYDNPLNSDLHEVVPGKFIAFRGPKNLGGPSYVNNLETHSRQFDPKYYLDIFKDLNVTTVIRLNEAMYSGHVFSEQGIQHHDLYFDDCSSPSPEVVKRFFDIVNNASGVIAIHCKAGLGRTGTLIALHLMRSHGFSAREAIGWLRLMRPGSVIGEQQQFLCNVHSKMISRLQLRRSISCIPQISHTAAPATEVERTTCINSSSSPARNSISLTNEHAESLAAQVSAGLERAEADGPVAAFVVDLLCLARLHSL